jgi:hypothetical protein
MYYSWLKKKKSKGKKNVKLWTPELLQNGSEHSFPTLLAYLSVTNTYWDREQLCQGPDDTEQYRAQGKGKAHFLPIFIPPLLKRGIL